MSSLSYLSFIYLPSILFIIYTSSFYLSYYLFLISLLVLLFFFFLMIRRPPRSTLSSSSAASDVYKRQQYKRVVHQCQQPGHRAQSRIYRHPALSVSRLLCPQTRHLASEARGTG
eukprot:TRINITY_DN17643_c0_g1_i1.p4 TRINITY_DN17643_c0_g1~~TRINITY_DN17643_c0_g1_i1.p4  ORF type:complete len:115 (+),score=27.65 TRINITY_DN17643_c0_g1_i1:1-345(+)